VPWNAQPGLNLLLDKEGEYELGKEVGLQVQNPWWGPTSAFVTWGNAIARKTLMVDKVRGVKKAACWLKLSDHGFSFVENLRMGCYGVLPDQAKILHSKPYDHSALSRKVFVCCTS
jgi:hypothetical protein